MRAGVPTPGLHLDATDDEVEGRPSRPLGLTLNNLGPRAKGGDPEHADVLSVRVPTDDRPGARPFCIFGSAEQLLAFAAELAGVVAEHLDAEAAGVESDPAVEGDLAEALGEALDEVTARAEGESVTVDDVAQALTDVSARPWSAEPVDAEADG